MMKRLMAMLMATVLLLCAVPQQAHAAADYSWIKVKLSTNNATVLTMYASGKYFIRENGAEFTGGTVTVRSNGDGTMTIYHSGSQGEIYTGQSLSIMRERVSREAGYIKLNGRCYLGHFNLKVMSSGYIRVVNEVPLAHYLYGVVGYEMSNTFPIEALKAQAVAAKCYVLSNMTTSGDYYIGDTSAEQVYKGYNASYTNVIEAVDSTLDEILAVNGRMLCTYYAASNGGETLLPSQAWPSKRLSDGGYDIRLDPYDLGNAYSKMETVKLPVNMGGEISPALMNMLLDKASRALGYQVNQIDGIYSVSVHSPKYSGTSRCMSKCSIELAASQNGMGSERVTLEFYTSEFENYGVVYDKTLRAYWGEMDSSGYYKIYHVRFGHGVGMSQRGAQAMGSAGMSYREILKFYYPGASFASIDVSAPQDPINKNSSVEFTPSGSCVEAVTTGGVKLRSGAGTKYSSICTVPAGSTVYVYGSNDGWAQAVYDGKSGYISEKYLEYKGERPQAEATPAPSGSPAADAPEGVRAYGTVNGSGVNMRTGPGTSYESIDKLERDTQLYIYDSAGGWYLVSTPSGKKGYIISTYVSITGYPAQKSDADEEEEVPKADGANGGDNDSEAADIILVPESVASGIVTGQGVNFRNGPAVSYASIDRLDKNTRISIYGKTGGWYYGEAGGKLGYISESYVKVTDGEKQEIIKSQDDAATVPKQDDGGDTVKVGRVTASRVNMRIGPGTSYNSLKKLEKNTGVYILGQSGNWYSVQTGQLKGYVHKDYIQQTGTQKVNGGSDAAGRGVTTGSVRLRKGSNTDSAIIATLKKDTELILYGKKDGWYSVKTSDGTEGFVSSKYVKVTEAYAGGEQQNAGRAESDDAIGTGKTNTKVNMRQGPSSSTKKLARLPKGTEVTIYANENGWCLVEYKGTRGYIYAKYVTGTVHDKGTAVGTGENDKDTAANVDSGSGVVLPRGETNSKVNFRSGPNTKNTKVYETLKKGAEVEIIGQTGSWYYVVYGGQAGFISSDYLKPTKAGTVDIQKVSSGITPQKCVTNSEVNIRSGPSTGSKKLGKLDKEENVTVYYVSDGWCFAKCGKQYGFLYDKYVSLANQ